MLANSDRKTLVLCGGGSGTHVLVADIARRPDWRVRVLTSRPDAWSSAVECREHTSRSDRYPLLGSRVRTYRGAAAEAFAWDDADAALRDADAVVISAPVHAHRSILERVLPALDPAQPVVVGSLFAQGGFDWIVRDLLERLGRPLPLAGFFGLKRFPLLCKGLDYGRSVTLYGRFSQTVTAISAADEATRERVVKTLGSLFRKPVVQLPSFLSCTLNMSNQLLHPAISWGHFHDYVPGRTVYPERRRFYADANVLAVRGMEAVYRDLFALTRALGKFTGLPLTDYLGIDPLMRAFIRPRLRVLHNRGIDGIGPLHYGEEVLTLAAFRLNRRLNRVLAPMLPSPDGRGFIPDLNSRFWTDDIGHGLCVLYGLGLALGLALPRIAAMIGNHQVLMGKRFLVGEAPGPDFATTNAPQRYGAENPAGLRQLLAPIA